MNLTLHHFRKEFRYLRLRWFAFLALLGLDLAVNLEWVFPMQWDEAAPFWIHFIPIAAALVVLSFVEGCPEDRPGRECGFIATRPQSRRSYWGAALMVFFGLVVLPAALENGLYLWLSARPFADVLRGMGERGIFVAGLGLWMLPVRALTLEREKWFVGGLGLILAILGVFVMPILLRMIDEDAPTFDLPETSWIYATLILAVSLTLLARVNHWRPLGQGLRVGIMALLFLGTMLLCLYLPMRTAPLENRDPARVAAMEAEFQPPVHLEELSYHEGVRGPESIGSLFLRSRIYPAAPGIHVTLKPKGARVVQNAVITDEQWKPWVNDSRFRENLGRVDSNLAAFFPENTLFVLQPEKQSGWTGVSNSSSNSFAGLSPAFDREQPLSVQAQFQADWWLREKLLDSACVAGTTASARDVTWDLLETLPHQILDGNKGLVSKRGAFSLRLRLNVRQHWDRGLNTAFILHSPQRRLAWVGHLETMHDERGGGSGMARQTLTLGWQDILNYADGEDAQVDREKLRLVLISGYHLGESTWTWHAPPIVPRDYFSETNQRQVGRMIHAGGGRNSFRERISSLQAPTARSSEAEVRRYLYDVIVAIQSDWSSSSAATKQDEEAALQPIFEHHLASLLDVPRQLWQVGEDSVPEKLFLKYLTDRERDAVIQRLADHPHLIRIVIQRGWTDAARDYWHDRLMRSGHLPDEFIPLLLAWGDAASLDRIVRAMSYKIDSWQFIKAGCPPELIGRLRLLADKQFTATTPFVDQFSETASPLRTAADFGNAQAMKLCLRQLSLDGKANRFNSPLPHLIDNEGKRIGMSYDEPDSNTKLFRHRGVTNFDYEPEKLGWRVLP